MDNSIQSSSTAVCGRADSTEFNSRSNSPQQKTIVSPWLLAREAAAYCRFSYDHWKALQAAGQTPAIRSSRGTIRYTVAALDRWLGAR